MTNKIKGILEFIQIAEKLKTELRHSWTKDPNRQESVAEHTWMMSLIALIIFPEIKAEFDQLKTLKMIIIHDLTEAINGDIPAFHRSGKEKEIYKSELKALQEVLSNLTNEDLKKEIMELWKEFEAKETIEAKIARALDRLEVLIQHNISEIETWEQGDYNIALFSNELYHDFDEFINELKNEVDRWTIKKCEDCQTSDRLNQEELRRIQTT